MSKFKNRQVSLIITIILTVFYAQNRWTNYFEGAFFMRATGNLLDADRAKAGIWVSKNTIEKATVYTGWGLPGYYSNRFIYDLSFLNRKFENKNLVSQYKPDVLIYEGRIYGKKDTAQCTTDILDEYHGYHIVKTFISYFKKTGGKYCYFVAIRDEKTLLPT